MYSAVRNGDLQLIKVIGEPLLTDKSLCISAERGYIEIVKYLLDSGVSKSEKARRLAAESGHIEIVKLLA